MSTWHSMSLTSSHRTLSRSFRSVISTSAHTNTLTPSSHSSLYLPLSLARTRFPSLASTHSHTTKSPTHPPTHKYAIIRAHCASSLAHKHTHTHTHTHTCPSRPSPPHTDDIPYPTTDFAGDLRLPANHASRSAGRACYVFLWRFVVFLNLCF